MASGRSASECFFVISRIFRITKERLGLADGDRVLVLADTTADAYLYPVPRKWYHKALFSYFKRWSRRKLDFRVEGLENVEKGRQYIFCPNHQTHFDGLFVWTALGDKCPDIDSFGCMSKAEHLDRRVTSLMMKTLGGIPVDRTG